MSYSKKRTDYNNNYPEQIITFSGQLEFNNLLQTKGITHIFKPIKLPLIEDFNFQRLLSFKIDIYEQLPNRPDIAFDLCWRTFEAYSSFFANKLDWNTKKTHIITNKICEDILLNQYSRNLQLLSTIKTLFRSIPLQATEFLVRRLFESASVAIESQQNNIIERVEKSIGKDLYEAVKTKYGHLTPDNQRKAGMLLQLIIAGEKVSVGERQFQLNLLETLKLIANGILYTYRNERFHGDAFSPFKSSKTQIKTYAYSYYCLNATYVLLAQLIYYHFPDKFDLNLIAGQLDENIARYNLVFSSYRKR